MLVRESSMAFLIFLVVFLQISAAAVGEEMDNADLVEERDTITIQGMETGDSIDLECKLVFTSIPVSEIRSTIDGKRVDNKDATGVTRSVMDQPSNIFKPFSLSHEAWWVGGNMIDDYPTDTTEYQEENNDCIYYLGIKETGNITPDTEMEERDNVSTIQKMDNDEAPPWFLVLSDNYGRGDSRNRSFWEKKRKGQFPIPSEMYNQKTRCKVKMTLIEKSNNNKRLIENRHKRANDIEVNPGPTTRNLKELENFLRWEDSQQAQFQNQIHEVIINLVEDAKNRIIPEEMYTEDSLNTIQDMFFLTVKKNYETDIVEKMDYLLTHFYDTVREEENKQGTFKRRFQESGVEIITFHGGLKRDIGTQFPEKLATTSKE